MGTIIYHATTATLGETTPEDRAHFRAWAAERIQTEFPGHAVVVCHDPYPDLVETRDITPDEKDEIREFCAYLWDDWCYGYPW